MLEGLRAETRGVLREALRGSTEVALLDVPWHHNLGDRLIYLAELEYMRQLGIEVRFQSTLFGPVDAPLRKLHPDGPILLQAGGNFGDLWHNIQLWREDFIRNNPDRRIVMLTNSIYFQREENIRSARTALTSHPDLTILLRDHRSIEFAEREFPGVDVRYCPDIALGAPIARAAEPPPVDVMVIRRADRDSDIWQLPDGVTTDSCDWWLSDRDLRMMRLLRLPGRAGRKVPQLAVPLAGLRAAGYRRAAGLAVDQAVRLVSRGRVLVTDRMHAAVMGAMLGIPTVALDLAYGTASQGQVLGRLHEGKISAAFDCWLGEFPNAHLCRDPDSIAEMVTSII